MRTALVAGILVALGCSKPSPPTLIPERATLTHIDSNGMEFDLELAATNANSVDLTASDLTAHVVLGKEEVGTVRAPTSITLGANKTTQLDVPVSMSWPDLVALVRLAAAGATTVPYSVEGTLDMGGELLHIGIPFHFNGTVSRDQILTAALPQPNLPLVGPPD